MGMSNRTKELLTTLTRHSNSTKYVWVVMNLFSLILLTSIINEKWGGNLPRISVRHWNEVLSTNAEDSMPSNEDGKLAIILSSLSGTDSTELDKLQGQQLVDFEVVKIPLLGVGISARDTSFIAALALLLIYIWYLLASIKERSVLCLLLYPIVAKEGDEQAKLLWGVPNKDDLDSQTLSDTIEKYKKEVYEIREVIPSRFLTLYANPKGRVFEGLTAMVLTFTPILLLGLSIGLDFYWDYFKVFKETGKTFHMELCNYERNLSAYTNFALQQSIDGNEPERYLNYEKVRAAYSEVRAHIFQTAFKRGTSVVLLVVLAVIAGYEMTVGFRMTKILTNMFEKPENLHVKEYLDI